MQHLYKNSIIVGWNKISEKFIDANCDLFSEVIIVDLEKNHDINPDYKIISSDNFSSIFVNNPESIFYFFENFDFDQSILLSENCQRNDCSLFFISNIDSLDSKHFVDLRNFNIIFKNNKWYRRTLIRLLDILMSTIILIGVLPLMIIIGALIFFEDGLPILFKQKRAGLNGKIFSMYKLRSMNKNTKKYSKSPSKELDDRITRVGKFIRKTSLDEFPQFLNVIKGEMSIVGPRPEMKFIVDQYNDFERLRLKVKPGITGPWQLSSARNLPIHYNVDYDIHQMLNNSLKLNIKQIFKTIFLSSRGR